MLIWRCLAVFVCGCLLLLYLEVQRARAEISGLRAEVVQVQALNVQIERLVAQQRYERMTTAEPLKELQAQTSVRYKNETESLRSVPKDVIAQQERKVNQGKAADNQSIAAQRAMIDPPLQDGQFPPGVLGQLLEKTHRKN